MKAIKTTITKEGNLRLTVEATIKELGDGISVYEINSRVKDLLTKKVAEEIWNSQGDKITKEVLEDVNWPELVRSRIIQKSIKAIGNEY